MRSNGIRTWVRRWAVVVCTGLAGVQATVARGADCTQTSTGLVPLTDLRSGLYLGQFQGGLYPGGVNFPPFTHHIVGVMRAHAVEPLGTDGEPSAEGKYVLLSIGMSNTTQEFCAGTVQGVCRPWTFGGQAAASPAVNHIDLEIVDGARGGQAAPTWDSPDDANYDRIRDEVLAARGLSEAQVQAVWIKVANAAPTVSLPDEDADALVLVEQMGNIARAVRVRYPNVKVAFLSSRIYAGYASTGLNPEPYAYESGLAVKWVIAAQIAQMAGGGIDPRAGDLSHESAAPWLAWGPYLWADGLTPRGDGLIWECANLDTDGTHPSESGEEKVGALLMQFMLSSPYAVPWFRSNPPTCAGACGDIDGSGGVVDLGDFAAFATCFRMPAYSSAECACADMNGDLMVDLADFALFSGVYGGVASEGWPCP